MFRVCLCLRPAYGGKYCEGSSRSYKLCNTEDCAPNATDYRAQQCAEYNSKQFRGWYYTWRPYTRVDGGISETFFLKITQQIVMMLKGTHTLKFTKFTRVVVIQDLRTGSGHRDHFLSNLSPPRSRCV